MASVEIKPSNNLNPYRIDYEDKSWILNSDAPDDALFIEALQYKNLKLIDVGEHISVFLSGSEIHIHFRRNLDKIKPEDFNNDFELYKAFSKRIGADLSLLSKMLSDNDPLFEGVETIVGLTGLGPAWGRKHGWKTTLYTQDPLLIKLHESTIENKPMETQPSKLTIFTISRDEHIKHFSPPIESLPAD